MTSAEFHQEIRNRILAEIRLDLVREMDSVDSALFYETTDTGIKFSVYTVNDLIVSYEVSITGRVVAGNIQPTEGKEHEITKDIGGGGDSAC